LSIRGAWSSLNQFSQRGVAISYHQGIWFRVPTRRALIDVTPRPYGGQGAAQAGARVWSWTGIISCFYQLDF